MNLLQQHLAVQITVAYPSTFTSSDRDDSSEVLSFSARNYRLTGVGFFLDMGQFVAIQRGDSRRDQDFVLHASDE